MLVPSIGQIDRPEPLTVRQPRENKFINSLIALRISKFRETFEDEAPK